MGIPKDLIDFVAEEGLATPSAAQTNGRTAVDHPVGWGVAWLVLGGLMLGNYAVMHEAIHAHLYRSKRANRVTGIVWGLLVGANFSVYRAYHLQHHSHTRIEGDTEPHEDYRGAGQYLFYTPLIGLLFWFQLAGASFASLLGKDPWYARTERQRRDIRTNAVILTAALVAAAAAALANPTLVLKAWAIPFLISTVAVSIVTLPEHYGCDQVPDYFRSTRTTLSNPVVQFLFWNNNFHAAHHIYPAVPYDKVGKLHDYTVGRTAYVAPSYTAFHLGLFGELLHKSKAAAADAAAPAAPTTPTTPTR